MKFSAILSETDRQTDKQMLVKHNLLGVSDNTSRTLQDSHLHYNYIFDSVDKILR